MEDEQRRKKLEFGREKLADFRQRKAKLHGPEATQKKKRKKKSPTGHPDDLPPQEHPLVVLGLSGAEQSSEVQDDQPELPQKELAVQRLRITELEEQLNGKELVMEQLTGEVEYLQEQLTAYQSTEQLQELEMAVQKRNDIIGQLTENLQLTIQNRDQVQQETVELTDQIQSLQHQLHQASEILRSRSPGLLELLQAQEQIAVFQQSLKEQSKHLESVEQRAYQLQLQLEDSEQNVKDKENLLVQIVEQQKNTEKTVQQLNQWIEEKEETMKELREMLDVKDAAFLQLQLSLGEQKVREEDVVIPEQVDAYSPNQGEQLRAQLEAVHTQEIVRIKQEMSKHIKQEMEDLNAKHKADLEDLQNQLDKQTMNEQVQPLNANITQLHKMLEARDEKAGAEEKCSISFQDLEEEVKVYKYEHECLTRDINEQNARLAEEVKLNEELRQKHQHEITNYQIKLHMMEQEKDQVLSRLAESQEAELEKLRNELLFSHEAELCHLQEQLREQQRVRAVPFSNEQPGVKTMCDGPQNTMGERPDQGEENLAERCRKLTMYLHQKESELEVLHMDLETANSQTAEALKKCQVVSDELSAVRSVLDNERREHHEEQTRLQAGQELTEQSEQASMEGAANWTASELVTLKEMVKDLKQEKGWLLTQLREQEQLVQEVQEQKLAANSVTSEVQALFGRQLVTLQNQRDQLQAQLDIQIARSQTTSELLGHKTMQEESMSIELADLHSMLRESQEREKQLQEERVQLESSLSVREQDLSRIEETLCQVRAENDFLQKNNGELSHRLLSAESERLLLGDDLKRKILEMKQLEDQECGHLQRIASLELQLNSHRTAEQELEQRLAAEMQQQEERLSRAVQQAQEQITSQYQEVTRKSLELHASDMQNLRAEHQKEVDELKFKMHRAVHDMQERQEGESRKQIGFIKQVHERERERELSRLMTEHKQEVQELRARLTREQQQLFDDLWARWDSERETELQQAHLHTETEHKLELESMRLSLNNMHTAQLELVQCNLQREKEEALVELQETLNEKRCQELAMLQSRQHLESERLREQTRQHIEECREEHRQEQENLQKVMEEETAALKAKADMVEAKRMQSAQEAWEEESQKQREEYEQFRCTEHQVELEELRQRVERLQSEVEAAYAKERQQEEKNEVTQQNLERLHQCTLTRLKEECAQQRHELQMALEDQEKEHRAKIEMLQSNYGDMKSQSKQELDHLWSQMECMRTSRQELNEFRKHVFAHTAHMDEVEHLKQDFAEQRERMQAEQHTQLQQLKIFFEKKISEMKEEHSRELTQVEQQVQEQLKPQFTLEPEVSLNQTPEISLSLLSFTDHAEKDYFQHRMQLLEDLVHKLEQEKETVKGLQEELEGTRKQQATSSQLHKQQLQQLEESFLRERQDLQAKHHVELQHLHTKHSEEHLKEVTRLRLQCAQESARQVEAEVAERLQALEEEKTVCEAERHRAADLQVELERLKEEHATAVNQLSAQHCHTTQLQVEQVKTQLLEDQKEKVEEARRLMGEAKELECESKLQHVREELQASTQEKLSALHQELSSQFDSERCAMLEQAEHSVVELKLLKDEQAATLASLEKQLKEEQNQLQLLRDSLEDEQSPQLAPIHQKLQVRFDAKLVVAKAQMAEELERLHIAVQEQSAAKLQEAQSRFMEEHRQMMETFMSDQEILLQELKQKHEAELESHSQRLNASHQDRLAGVEAESGIQHQAELKAKLEAAALEHKAELEEAEQRHQAVLQEFQQKEQQLLLEAKSRQQQDLETAISHSTEKQAHQLQAAYQVELSLAQDSIRTELATCQRQQFQAMATELEEAHKVALELALREQRSVMEQEHQAGLHVIRNELQNLEEHHQQTLEDLQCLHTAQVDRQREEYTQRLTEELQQLQANNVKEQEDFREEKSRSLEEAFAQKLEVEKQLHQEEKRQLAVQLQQQIDHVTQLQEEVRDKRSELDILLQRRDRENEEGSNLEAMLRADLQRLTHERKDLQCSHERVLKLLSDVARTMFASEDLISRRIGTCLENNQTRGQLDNQSPAARQLTNKSKARLNQDSGESLDMSLISESVTEESSAWSTLPDEGQELSQWLSESMFAGPEMALENQELVRSTCARLHVAVVKLLELVTESTKQLAQTHGIREHMEEELTCVGQEAMQFVGKQHQQLLDRLSQEAEGKKQLTLELHKAKGLIEGYVAEKAELEEALCQKEKSEHHLVVEVESFRQQLLALRREQQALQDERDLLTHQLQAMAANQVQQELVEETERLSREKLEIQCQAEKDRAELLSRVTRLEAELEEETIRGPPLEDQWHSEVTDLQQHIQALEKQLKNYRQFMDEQAAEREHERDEFQTEITKLETRLKVALKSQGASDYADSMLEAQIQAKTEDYSKLLVAKEHLERVVAEQQEELGKLDTRIKELEQALLPRSTAEIRASQLEQEVQIMKRLEEELTQDKESLQQQQYSNLMQISALQSKLDQARHRVPTEGLSEQALKELLQEERQALHNKEAEIHSLEEQLDQFQENLMNKTDEVLQLSMQLEIQTRHSSAALAQLNQDNLRLEEDVASLRLSLGLDAESGRGPTLQLPQALLQEKNQEIDELNQQIFTLQNEFPVTLHNKIFEEKKRENEELTAQIERLTMEQERLRSDRKEETEQLHEVIEKLQQEMLLLNPNRHEVSDTQEDPGLELGQEARPGLRQLTGHSENLQQELAYLSVHPAECEEAVWSQPAGPLQPWAEKEAELQEREATLQASLQHLQGVNEQQQEELASLNLQQDTLWEDNCLLRRHVSQNGAEVEQLSAHVQELQEQLRHEQVRLQQAEALPARLVELEQKVEEKTSAVQQASAEMQILRSQLTQRDSQLEAGSQKNVTCQEELTRLQQQLAGQETQLAELQQQLAEQEPQSNEQKQYVKQIQEERRVTNNGLPTAHSQIGAGDGLHHLQSDQQHHEQQMSQLLAAHKKLQEELTLAKEQLNSSTETIQMLLEQIQEKDRTITDLEVHECNLRTQVSQLQEALLRQQGELADQASQVETMRKQDGPEQGLERLSAVEPEEMNCQIISLTVGQEAHAGFVYNHIETENSLSSPELMRKYEESMEWMNGLHSTHISELSAGHSISLSGASSQDKATVGQSHQRPQLPSPPQLTEALCQSAHSPTESQTDRPKNERRVERSSTVSIPEWISDGYCSNASWDLGVRLNQELDRTERLDNSFVEYLQQRGIEVLTDGDSILASDAHEAGELSPQLQVLLRKVHEEGCRILALTARPGSQGACGSCIRVEEWQREQSSLLQTIQLLRSLLPHTACTPTQERAGVERLLVADGSSLLAEVQALHAQLRLLILQHQEELSTAQDQASPLRKQVDVLQCQLQEEQVLAVEMERLLGKERNRVAELRQAVQTEQASVAELKAELSAVTQELEAAVHAQQQQRQHLESLRAELNVKENELLAALTSLTQERQKVSGLQDLVEDEREHHREQAERQNQELQELQRALEQQKGGRVLPAGLQHSPPQYTQPQLPSQRGGEECDSGLQREPRPSQEQVFMRELQRQLEEERSRTVSLAAMIQTTQQQVIAAKRQLETESQQSQQESQREREVSSHLRSTLHSVQEQVQELTRLLQAERQHGLQLQAHTERLQEAALTIKQRERSRSRQRERERRQERQAWAESEQSHNRTRERMQALEEQFRGEQQRVQNLQQMLAELEEQERNLTPHRRHRAQDQASPTTTSTLKHNMEPQLITHIRELLQSTRTRLDSGGLRTEEDVVKLLGSLSEISCEMQQLYSRPEARPTDCAAAEQAAWPTERRQLLHALKQAELQLAEIQKRPLVQEPADSSHAKMQRLYSRYLRAESFRKALVYQKKYLLLLLGGFQDCEQATLSLIARMGVYPSPSDLLIPCHRSRAFTRFRSVIRVVIAISRLSFLVKKWQKATRRGLHSAVTNTGYSPASVRGEVLLQQQPNSSHSTNSPPTRDRGSSHRPHLQPSKPPVRLQHRSNQSLVSVSISGLDPEHSLTEYIQRLEAIQHRLGGGHTGSPQHTNSMK